jgi:hypothetical protein
MPRKRGLLECVFTKKETKNVLPGFRTIYATPGTKNMHFKGFFWYYCELPLQIVFYLVILIIGIYKIRKEHERHSLFTKFGVVRVSVYAVIYTL